MRMPNLKQVIRKIKKSQVLLVGSLLVFVGFCILFGNYFIKMRDAVFTEMQIEMNGNLVIADETENDNDVSEVPITNNLPEDNKVVEYKEPPIDYSKYLGVLEIPKIGLKRGFYNIGSRYNDVQYNVTVVDGSTMPDVLNGNLILMAHSGWASISYFQYLYNLSLGDHAYVTYGGNKYSYKLVNIYDVAKTGKVKIVRSYDKTTLTLITCTRNNDKAQTVYILELV